MGPAVTCLDMVVRAPPMVLLLVVVAVPVFRILSAPVHACKRHFIRPVLSETSPESRRGAVSITLESNGTKQISPTPNFPFGGPRRPRDNHYTDPRMSDRTYYDPDSG